MFMKPSQFIYKDNKKHKHIRKQWKWILKISTHLKKRKVYKTQWRKIYEVIEEAYFKDSGFPDDFIKKCKDNANKAQWVPLEIKNNTKWMEMEQGLYAEVVMLCWKDLKLIVANGNKNEAKSKFQCQSARSQS